MINHFLKMALEENTWYWNKQKVYYEYDQVQSCHWKFVSLTNQLTNSSFYLSLFVIFNLWLTVGISRDHVQGFQNIWNYDKQKIG